MFGVIGATSVGTLSTTANMIPSTVDTGRYCNNAVPKCTCMWFVIDIVMPPIESANILYHCDGRDRQGHAQHHQTLPCHTLLQRKGMYATNSVCVWRGQRLVGILSATLYLKLTFHLPCNM